jgi:hypothetical protein
MNTKNINTAQGIADELGQILPDENWLQKEIERLNRRNIVTLGHVQNFHEWLDEKRKARRSCRLIGESRTGKTVACEAYFFRNKPKQKDNQAPVVPVIYIMIPPKAGPKEIFTSIIKALNYKANKGSIADLRSRTWEVLKSCQVEMLMIDEADRIKLDAFPDVRDINDGLGISIVLIGTDRLDAVIRRDEQVQNRFLSNKRFGKLAGDEFTKTLTIWEKNILKLPIPSNLTSKEKSKILMATTQGSIGKLDELLREAAIRSLCNGYKKIEMSVLQDVAREYR